MAGESFGNWLKRQRTSRGLTQGDLVERAGFDRSHISKIENGRIGLPEKATRDRLHAALGTSDDDLVEAGLLDRLVSPDSGEPFYVPVSDEDRLYRLDMGADTLSDAMNSPHMRASFLRIGELSPARQKQLAELIDTLYEADEAYRRQMKRDRERRQSEGIEE